MVDRNQEIEASTAASEAEAPSQNQEEEEEEEEEEKVPQQDVGPSAQATLAQMDLLINGEGDEEQINSSVWEFLEKIRRESEEQDRLVQEAVAAAELNNDDDDAQDEAEPNDRQDQTAPETNLVQ